MSPLFYLGHFWYNNPSMVIVADRRLAKRKPGEDEERFGPNPANKESYKEKK
jgi:hypothetical protein